MTSGKEITMVNRNWLEMFDGGMNQMNQGMLNNAQQLPTQTAPNQYASPQVSPTRQYVQRNVTNSVVPHVHPSHLTTVNQQYIHNQHHFPHTQSVVNECYETNTMCGTPFRPGGCGCQRRRGW